MKINNVIYIVLILFSFQYYVSTRKHLKYYERELQDELLDLLERYETAVDPNDHVNIKLWNKLNAEDIKNMPQIDDYSNEDTAMRWLEWLSRVSLRYNQVSIQLTWNAKTDITKENRKAKTEQQLLTAPFHRMALPIAKKFNKYMKNSTSEDLKRTYGRLAQGSISHNDEKVKQKSKLHSKMTRIYSTAKVCELNDTTKCYPLAPYLERLMQVEKDYDRLLWAWKGWHDQCGNKVRPIYLSYIDLVNENDKENGYKDISEKWIEGYEMGSETEFEGILDQLLEDIMPLYKQLHAYVRGRLCEIYPNRFDCNGPIPAHLLGNMWSQAWQDRLQDIMPYSDTPLIDLTHMLHKKHYSIDKMFKTAEDFFTSINLYPMTPKFWARSMFTKPTDREVVCHASAFNFLYHDDYRIKMCTIIDEDNFYTIHHEMGHIEYYMAYTKQPYFYQSGANSAFHEAIGDTIGMYAISPSHLTKLGFLDEDKITRNYEINYLMRMALQKIAFLPFGYVMDKYRFMLFRNQIDRKHNLNGKWWELRIKHGGIMPPVSRNDPENFDAGAKYHVVANSGYFKYFIAHILQFQFYRAMCRIQGHTKRLHMCDIYGNKDVGDKFKAMLAKGASKSWSEILESLSGETKLESKAILDYFEPLYKWLKKENVKRGYPIGWME